MDIYFRYGMTKEKKLFLDSYNKNLHSGIIIPANIALDQVDSLPEWLAVNRINYFIDPITFVFNETTANICNSNGEIRRSFNKYIEALNITDIDFSNDVIDIGYFQLNDKFDPNKISNFVSSILRMQVNTKKLDEETKNFIELIQNEEETSDYPIEIAVDSGFNPLFYTSPGFFFDSPQDPWFKLDIRFMEETIKHSGDQKTFGYLPFSKNIFNQDCHKEIVDAIPSELNGLVVWFEDFEDTTASESELRFVASVINEFGKRKFDVINLYGGFFSALLSEIGCAGYSSGLCYNTRRTRLIEPSGGPLPFRYYIPEINKLMRQSDTESFYKIVNPDCDCPECKNKKENNTDKRGTFHIDGFVDSFFSYNRLKEGDYASKEESLKNHFIYSTNKQISEIQKNGVNDYLDKKMSVYNKIVDERGETIANMYASHIPKWNRVLDQFL